MKKNETNTDVYISQGNQGAVKAAEFTQAGNSQYAAFHTKDSQASETLLKELRASNIPVSVISNIPEANGEHVVICNAQCSKDALLSSLNQQGEALIPEPEEPKGHDRMFWRGCTSIVGQVSQLISSGTTVKKDQTDVKLWNGISGDVGAFAVFNLVANACNMKFGSQHKIDHHHTIALKEQFNQNITELLGDDVALPDPLRKAMDDRPPINYTLPEKLYNFAQQQSITIGEVGLRMLGTTAMIIPVNHWANALKELPKGDFVAALKELKLNPDPVNRRVGIVTMAGKISSLLAKEKDPYNPKERNFFDTFREDYAFKTSSVIEGVAATDMMIDRVRNRRSTLGSGDLSNYDPDKDYDNLQRDWAGGFGNAVFIGGYVIRFPAPVGSLDVDKPELFAHISDGLALLPKEEIPATLAGVAISLKQHFADDKHVSVASIYADIADDLEKQHNIVMPDVVSEAMSKESRIAAQDIQMNIRSPRESRNDIVPFSRLEQTEYKQRVSATGQEALIN